LEEIQSMRLILLCTVDNEFPGSWIEFLSPVWMVGCPIRVKICASSISKHLCKFFVLLRCTADDHLKCCQFIKSAKFAGWLKYLNPPVF
jgi:hypothetical protein